MSKKRKNLIAILGVLSVALITTGATYAFFSYSRSGSTENTIKSGSITFLYDEINRSGNSIGIVDALPTSDTDGKAQTNAFNFKIQSTTATDMAIPYEITLRQKAGTDNIGDKIKVYLSKTTGYEAAVNTEEEVVTSLFSSLPDTTHNGYSEKTLHTDEVPASAANYTQNYRLKMWLDESVDLSNETYNGKTFTVMVNVYANGRIASSNANVESISVNNTELTAVNANEYEITLEPETTQATVKVETEDDNSTVTITKTESDYSTPIAENGEMQRLSKSVNKTVNLTIGDNYFKIVVKSENNQNNKTQHLKITIPQSSFVLKDQILADNPTRYTNPTLSTYFDGCSTNDGFGEVTSKALNSTTKSNYFVYADSYTFDSVNGYTLVNAKICKYSECYNTLKGKYLKNVNGSSSSELTYHDMLSKIYKVDEQTTSSTLYYSTAIRSYYNCDETGLYSDTYIENNSNKTTYYFRGLTISNNYLRFANIDWRIVRINEDGTIRLILSDVIDSKTAFSSQSSGIEYMYYSNSVIKNKIDTWYDETIGDNNEYESKIAKGNYFCEMYSMKYSPNTVSRWANNMYLLGIRPSFKCEKDENNHQYASSKVGLLTEDEYWYAGGFGGYGLDNWLYINNKWYWLSSPTWDSNIYVLTSGGNIAGRREFYQRPVINLKADVIATGSGTESDPYVVQ